MNIRRLQGWALIISGLLGLLGILGSDSLALRAVLIAGVILLILGVPAIGAVERLGSVGLAGLILVELAAVVALLVNLMPGFGNDSAAGALPLVSALAGALGRVIVGWITARGRVFPAWAGWAFMLEGVLNLAGGLVAAPAMASVFGIVLPLVGAAALIGYGLGIVRHDAAARPLSEAIPATGKK